MPSAARVTLSRTGKSFAVNHGEVILDAALRQQIWLPHACRGGTCGTCKAVVVAGIVAYDETSPALASYAPPGQPGSQTEAFLCCAKAAGDVTLDVAELPARPSGTFNRRPARVIDIQRRSHDV